MAHDITQIKDRLDLIEVMRRDGHEARRMGSGWFVNCPFHEEKSPSCKVEERKFKCFGCGAGGDVFDYWEKSRGISKKDTLDQLASLAGVAPSIDGYTKPLARPAPKPKPEEIVTPLTGEERADWLLCVENLLGDPAAIARIAAWRGIDGDVIRWAAERGIMGLKKWFGQWREAFLVEMPEAPHGPFLAVTTHIRLGPHTQGNERPKASWRFDPHGRGAWPLVFGDLTAATHIFFLEGQWDALALIHLMRWHTSWPTGIAIVAMRGATSFRKFLTHYALNPKAIGFAIADADSAGAEWFSETGLIHQLSTKIHRVHSFWPGQRKADLNDLVKAGTLTRDRMVALLTPKLRNRRNIKPSGPTFLAWSKKRVGAPDPIGRAARMVVADPSRPGGRQPKKIWERHWRKLDITPDLAADLSAAWDTYKSECTTA